MPKSRPVVIAFTSDQHCGGSTALCPEEINLDDGGSYKASKLQRWLWQGWGDFWGIVAERVRQHDAAHYQVFHGDCVDGAHHKTTQILSENPNAQAAVWNACVSVPLALKPDKLYFIRGTEAHVGQSASAEERIADGLRRDKRPVVSDPETRTASWWHARIVEQGIRIDIAHHGRTGMREHTRGGAAVLYAHDIFLNYAKAGEPHPHLAVRGHHHRFNDSHDAAPTRVITTGCWQMPTGYVKKIAADSLPDIGGLIVVIRDGQMLEPEKIHFTPTRTWHPA